MKLIVFFLTFILLVFNVNSQNKDRGNKVDNILNIKVKDIEGKTVNLSDYKDKVLLIVNVASYCGYTRQYSGLQELYENFKDDGFDILAFPCNQFGNQEPGSNEEIKNFCSTKYNLTFKLFDKIEVNGNNKSPLYSVLTDNPVTGKSDIKWNFEKFIVGKNGKIVKRFPSAKDPLDDEVINTIKKELKKS